MKLRGHIMSSVTQAVLEAADAWATAVKRVAAAEEFNQNDDDAVNARDSAEVDLLAAIERWRQEGGLSQ
jgi:hypothetical protein